MRNNVILISVLLAGCSTFPTSGVKIEVQKVEVPVVVPCKVDTPTEPQYNFDKVSEKDDIFVKVKALLADRKLYQGYTSSLLTSLEVCKK